MIKVVYIVSTLKRAGPVNQLYNIVKYLDRNIFEPYLITLSPEPLDSIFEAFVISDVTVIQLNLSRFRGILFAKQKVKKLITEINPDFIHTQGIRPDDLLSKIRSDIPWFITVHNYPSVDYVMKYGQLKGHLMSYIHFKSMKKCRNLIACSKTISNFLEKKKIDSFPIQNGVDFHQSDLVREYDNHLKPVFISVGSLIKRKNISFLIKAFNEYRSKYGRGELIILGDGPEMEMLQNLAHKNIKFAGNVPNVADYLKQSDIFISASVSEGLPNTVLEALALGVPAMLSDIPSHIEITQEYSKACETFELKKGPSFLSYKMAEFENSIELSTKKEAINITEKNFSAKVMSEKYQKFYLKRTGRI